MADTKDCDSADQHLPKALEPKNLSAKSLAMAIHLIGRAMSLFRPLLILDVAQGKRRTNVSNAV
jgi:hypothetical protein